MTPIIDIVIFVLSLGLVTITLLPLIPRDHWVFRAWEFPRLQIAVLAIINMLAVSMFSEYEWRTTLLLINGLVLVYQSSWIIPFTPLVPAQVKLARPHQQAHSLKILTSNVLMTNRSADKLLDQIKKHQPDVIVTLESDSWWQRALEPIHGDYPYRVERPLDNLYGMHVYSRYELQHVLISDLIQQDVPSIHCILKYSETQSIKCHFLHPAPPSPTENERSTPRDKELILVAKQINDKEPTLVTGDLNDVAWSPTTRLFRKISGLQDPRIGRGFFNTFHAKYRFMRWPLDHIFHSKHFTLIKLERLPSIDSDHFPLLSELAFNEEETSSTDGSN